MQRMFFFVGQGDSFILETTSKLLIERFQTNEMALATSVAATIIIFIFAIGFLLDTQIVTDTTNMKLL